ncbi:MAG: hypothetical protein MUF20_13020 [Methylotetracoccus sp.]|nr:hypothetical protein [Methylotetracoccus sp.]
MDSDTFRLSLPLEHHGREIRQTRRRESLTLSPTKAADAVLDPLTVADDPDFIKTLSVQKNLPDLIKQGLATLL